MILRMSLPENAPNVSNFGLAKVETLLTPTKLWTRTEVLATPCPVPASAGVYAWFFEVRDAMEAACCIPWANPSLLFHTVLQIRST